MLIRCSISGIIRIIIIVIISIYSIRFNYITVAATQSDNLQQSPPAPNKVMDFLAKYPKEDDNDQGCEVILPTWATAGQNKNFDIVLANDQVPNWQDTGVNVNGTQELKIKILGVDKKNTQNQRKYLVLFRFDPRLPDQGNSFIIDVNTSLANNKGLSNTSNNNDNFTAALKKYANIFSNAQTTTINVQANDIINISLISPNESDIKMLQELILAQGISDNDDTKNSDAPYIIHTDSLTDTNRSSIYNTVLFFEDKDIDISILKPALVGLKKDVDLNQIEECNNSNQAMKPNCFMNMGRGMAIELDTEIVKEYSDQFIINPTIYNSNLVQQKYVLGLYHIVAKNAGNLRFVPPDNKNRQFINIPRINNQDYNIKSIQNFHDYNDYEEQYTKKQQHASLKSLFGSYWMRVIISSPDTINNTYNNDLEYIISDTPPDQDTRGTIIDKESVNIPVSSNKGKLWIRHASKISGTISLNIIAPNNQFIKYPIARIIGDNVYVPINKGLKSVSELLFASLAKNAEFQKLVYILVTLYVMWSGMQFLTAMSQLTAYEVSIRIIKIIAVTGLFTNYSIVHNYLFSTFNDGMHSIINSVVVDYEGHYSDDNPFYFLDTIINRYIDANFFKLLLVELVHIHNGLFIVAILIITSLYKFFEILLKAVIEIITSMITISILVSLGPLFIICLLFERTFQIFRKWLLATLANVLVAFLLIIFISVIDALIVNAIQVSAPSKICWSKFCELILNTDLSAIGISRLIDNIHLTNINFYNIIFETGGLFQGSGLSFGEVLSGALLLYYLSELSASLLGQTSLFRKKNVNISKKSYIKDLVQEILN